MNKLQTSAFVSIILLIIAFPLNAAVPTTPFQILGHIQNFCLDNQFNSATNSCPKDTEPRTPIPPFPHSMRLTWLIRNLSGPK